MQKLAYLITGTRRDQPSLFQLNQQLLNELPSKLKSLGCEHFSVNLFDETVNTAASLRIQNQQPSIDAVVFVWVGDRSLFSHVQSTLNAMATVLCAYSLSEYEPIPAPDELLADSGKRTLGMMQLAFLKVPSRLDYLKWLTTWREQHTQVAIDTQSTFIYRQNVVEECLTTNNLGYSAIVEEAFPLAAMNSQHAFYAASSDEQLADRQALMWQSSKRFIDLSDLDVLPTSEYRW